jgi:hypothetical protein
MPSISPTVGLGRGRGGDRLAGRLERIPGMEVAHCICLPSSLPWPEWTRNQVRRQHRSSQEVKYPRGSLRDDDTKPALAHSVHGTHRSNLPIWSRRVMNTAAGIFVGSQREWTHHQGPNDAEPVSCQEPSGPSQGELEGLPNPRWLSRPSPLCSSEAPTDYIISPLARAHSLRQARLRFVSEEYLPPAS